MVESEVLRHAMVDISPIRCSRRWRVVSNAGPSSTELEVSIGSRPFSGVRPVCLSNAGAPPYSGLGGSGLIVRGTSS